jgi:SAM-dependent methyltransferase
MTLALRPDTQTSRWYENNVRKFGCCYRALGYGRRASQDKRFAALLALGAFHGARLLDVGCGFGDLLRYLNARGIHPEYTGVDFCPPMIERCEERFAGQGARFVVSEALAYQPEQPFDYVIASGIFGYAAKGIRELIGPTLRRLYSWCRIGLAVNFLSGSAPRRSPARLYLDPWEMLQLALQRTPAVRLDHTYLPNDFTVCMYRTPAWQEEA